MLLIVQAVSTPQKSKAMRLKLFWKREGRGKEVAIKQFQKQMG
jgi:hypothetical protein